MSTKIRTFEDLIVWQKAVEFVKEVYLVTSEGELKRDFGLRDQIRRAACQFQLTSLRGLSEPPERSICSS